MKIDVTQVYVEAGAYYPFSRRFQNYISEELSRRVAPSSEFISEYAEDFSLVFNMSAKSRLTEPEVKGPTVFWDDKDIEYSVFLPFDKHRSLDEARYREVLALFLREVDRILQSFGMKVKGLAQDADRIIDQIVKTPGMFGE